MNLLIVLGNVDMDPAEVSVNVSETEQQSDPEEQLDDSKRASKLPSKKFIADDRHRLSSDSIRASVCLQAWERFGLFKMSSG